MSNIQFREKFGRLIELIIHKLYGTWALCVVLCGVCALGTGSGINRAGEAVATGSTGRTLRLKDSTYE